jgi:hypothetical protein
MRTGLTPDVLKNPDVAASYQNVYDLLTKAYWESSDMASKDLIYGVQQAIGEIITELDEADIDELTRQFAALEPKIEATNKSLAQIKEDIQKITKNISTATSIVSSITKVLSLLPA